MNKSLKPLHTNLCLGSALIAIATISGPASAQGQEEVAPATQAGTKHFGDDRYEIRFRADTLIVSPVISVGLVDSAATVVRGEYARFQTYTNYPSFIERAEVRIHSAGASPDSEPLFTLDVEEDGTATWQADEASPRELYFVLRVYDDKGKFDETAAHELTLLDEPVPEQIGAATALPRIEFGQIDEAARRTINLKGIMATVTGRADAETERIFVGGQTVPIAEDGRFAAQQIVSRDDGELLVVIKRDGQVIKEAKQSFAIESDDWLVVGQGDMTLGKSFGSGPSRDVSGDTLSDGSYAIGRGAFYAKGVVGDDWRITSSLDTGEELLKDIFSNLDRKDPRQLLRRLNSEQFYPTYGDDSTLVEDAPTQGSFYLRVNKDANQFVVGNFTTAINGAELAQLDRGLFGALVDINSQATTEFGERRFQLTGFASDPGTVPAREEFRGTGGSLYFLKRRDVSIGSERIRIEVRDRETGIVIETRDLYPQQDYDFDPYQGRVTLLKPLASTVANSGVVREGGSTGNVPVLVVRYEYTPTVGSLDGYTLGGRASGWLNEAVRFGVTAQRDTVEEAAQTLLGADVLLRATAGTYFKAEIAQSEGPGFGQSNSVDGGLSFTDIVTPGVAGVTAKAWRTEAAINVNELTGNSGEGAVFGGYFEHQDQGFSSAGRLTPADTERWGVTAKIPLANGRIAAGYESLSSSDTGSSETGTIDLENAFASGTGTIISKLGLHHEDRTPGLLFNSVQDGSRTDLAFELGYSPGGENWSTYGFGQITLDRNVARQRNNRAGVGLKAQITQRISISGEVSEGNGGAGADIQLNRQMSEGSEAYIGYSLFADRTDTGLDNQNIFTRSNRATLVLGARQRFSDALSVYGENRVGIGGAAPSLTRSLGLTFEPIEHLAITGSFEAGRIDDATTGVFRRTAATFGVGYAREDFRLGSSVEMRRETSAAGLDQTVWLLRNDFNYAIDPDWRFVGRVNLARADKSSDSVLAAEFTEAVAGFAYRPVDNEKLNALLRFSYFEDLGPVGQITGGGQTQSPKQVSHIGVIDFNYDASQKLTLGGKYGYRTGKVSLSRESNEFVSSTAHLAVLRADYNVVTKWDVLLEGRVLWVTAADDLRTGALAAAYRHIDNNVKIGVGYSLSDFSDDLSDQSYSSHGPFLNLLGKF
ncbi:hypothetical protein [Altererythrobacter sp.]|uniref:hypothetical protein n=1 Tax=Altererythrobacter sp. TaxID=1872480 RepID=UPI001B09483F|nr:hypothetical protein [Altererythrobacter sp.]MBO6944358.1 hypothetical protein [Altererythrobacter sp.]